MHSSHSLVVQTTSHRIACDYKCLHSLCLFDRYSWHRDWFDWLSWSVLSLFFTCTIIIQISVNSIIMANTFAIMFGTHVKSFVMCIKRVRKMQVCILKSNARSLTWGPFWETMQFSRIQRPVKRVKLRRFGIQVGILTFSWIY